MTITFFAYLEKLLIVSEINCVLGGDVTSLSLGSLYYICTMSELFSAVLDLLAHHVILSETKTNINKRNYF